VAGGRLFIWIDIDHSGQSCYILIDQDGHKIMAERGMWPSILHFITENRKSRSASLMQESKNLSQADLINLRRTQSLKKPAFRKDHCSTTSIIKKNFIYFCWITACRLSIRL